jgi:hypothetical protein
MFDALFEQYMRTQFPPDWMDTVRRLASAALLAFLANAVTLPLIVFLSIRENIPGMFIASFLFFILYWVNGFCALRTMKGYRNYLWQKELSGYNEKLFELLSEQIDVRTRDQVEHLIEQGGKVVKQYADSQGNVLAKTHISLITPLLACFCVSGLMSATNLLLGLAMAVPFIAVLLYFVYYVSNGYRRTRQILSHYTMVSTAMFVRDLEYIKSTIPTKVERDWNVVKLKLERRPAEEEPE